MLDHRLAIETLTFDNATACPTSAASLQNFLSTNLREGWVVVLVRPASDTDYGADMITHYVCAYQEHRYAARRCAILNTDKTVSTELYTAKMLFWTGAALLEDLKQVPGLKTDAHKLCAERFNGTYQVAYAFGWVADTDGLCKITRTEAMSGAVTYVVSLSWRKFVEQDAKYVVAVKEHLAAEASKLKANDRAAQSEFIARVREANSRMNRRAARNGKASKVHLTNKTGTTKSSKRAATSSNLEEQYGGKLGNNSPVVFNLGKAIISGRVVGSYDNGYLVKPTKIIGEVSDTHKDGSRIKLSYGNKKLMPHEFAALMVQ